TLTLPSVNEGKVPALATARSRWPSPLKSPTATDRGPCPAGKLRAVWKLPSPLPRSTLTLSLPKLATTRSSRPSPLTSPPPPHTPRSRHRRPAGRGNWAQPGTPGAPAARAGTGDGNGGGIVRVASTHSFDSGNHATTNRPG